MKSIFNFRVWIALAFALLHPHSLPAKQTCDNIKKIALPATAITAATSISPSSYGTPSRGMEAKVAVCRVEGVIEQQIGFELWLPQPNKWNERLLGASLFQKNHPEGNLSNSDWQLLATAAISACDGNDSVKDGVATDPESCSFDPKTIQCQGESRSGCLTAAQLEVVRAIYAPLKDENGKALDSGLLPGVRTRPGPPPQLAVDLFGQGVHHTTDWDPSSLNIAKELTAVDKEMPELKANDPRVKPFKDRGGKIIIYQGWMDPSVIASQSTDYYKSIEKTFGSESEIRTFLRLFMVPGMHHCAGGEATDHFGGSMSSHAIGDPDHDCLSAIVRWVEEGIAPDPIIASKVVDGKVIRTRPLCPYPERAVYKDSGSTDDAANFECRHPQMNTPKK
jgi:feruloyl esterase